MDTMTPRRRKADPEAVLEALLRTAQEQYERGHQEVEERRNRVIVTAVENGATQVQVARAMNLTVGRIAQILRDTRS